MAYVNVNSKDLRRNNALGQSGSDDNHIVCIGFEFHLVVVWLGKRTKVLTI